MRKREDGGRSSRRRGRCANWKPAACGESPSPRKTTRCCTTMWVVSQPAVSRAIAGRWRRVLGRRICSSAMARRLRPDLPSAFALRTAEAAPILSRLWRGLSELAEHAQRREPCCRIFRTPTIWPIRFSRRIGDAFSPGRARYGGPDGDRTLRMTRALDPSPTAPRI